MDNRILRTIVVLASLLVCASATRQEAYWLAGFALLVAVLIILVSMGIELQNKYDDADD